MNSAFSHTSKAQHRLRSAYQPPYALTVRALKASGWVVVFACWLSTATADEQPRAAFEQAFVSAFRSGNARLAERLFEWRGVDRAARLAIYQMIERDVDSTLVETRWLPPADDSQTLRQRGLESNVPVLARLAALFVDEQGRHYVSMHDVGAVNGTYFIALVRKLPESA
jgi:hypothetical protein